MKNENENDIEILAKQYRSTNNQQLKNDLFEAICVKFKGLIFQRGATLGWVHAHGFSSEWEQIHLIRLWEALENWKQKSTFLHAAFGYLKYAHTDFMKEQSVIHVPYSYIDKVKNNLKEEISFHTTDLFAEQDLVIHKSDQEEMLELLDLEKRISCLLPKHKKFIYLMLQGYTSNEIADILKISSSAISLTLNVILKKMGMDKNEHVTFKELGLTKACEPKPALRKISQKKAEKIRKLYETGKYTMAELAEQFEISESSINHIIHFISYK